MLSFAPLLASPSGTHELALALIAAAFILFALVSSFVLPRSNPNFPGNKVWGFVGATILFFVAMIAAVILFGKEQKSEASAPPATQSTSTTATAPSGGAQGNAQAGKAVFTSAGCSTCHTLKAAGSTGNIGPNLDQLKPPFAIVQHQVINGGGAMPSFKSKLSSTQIADVAAFVSQNAGK